MSLDSKEFMTGIEAIDLGHRQLVALINEVLDYQLENVEYDNNSVKQCVGKIVEYSIEHLDNEEGIMRSLAYPNYMQHLDKHNHFRNEINNIFDMFANVLPNDVNRALGQISDLLIHWLRTELLADDIRLAEYIKKINE